MSLRLVSALLLALALLMAPVAGRHGGTAAASEMSVEMAEMQSHCDEAAKPVDKSCCNDLGCMSIVAMQAVSPAVGPRSDLRRVEVTTALRSPLAGIFTEFEPPPPRA